MLYSEEILSAKQIYQASVAILEKILDSLDDLGDKMDGMLQQQTTIEVLAMFIVGYEVLNHVTG